MKRIIWPADKTRKVEINKEKLAAIMEILNLVCYFFFHTA